MEIEHPSMLDASEPVSRAINEISRSGLPVIVTKKGRYLGVIDERAIRQHTHPSKEKCGSIAERAPSLSAESTVMDACNAFFAGRFKAIPVLRAGKVLGAITRHTLLSELLQEKMLSRKRVSEVMTFPVAAIEATATVGQARAELRRHNIRRLVVTKDGRIQGILSIFDLASFVSSPKQRVQIGLGGEKTSMDSHPVISYMKKRVETISSTDTLSSAVRKMLESRVAALVVSDGGYPRGIVTAKDLFSSALSEEKTAQVFVSGLPYEHKDFHSQIVKQGERLISKVGKSFEVRSLAIHIKKEGPGFAVRARLDGKRHYNSSAFDFRLAVALRQALDEIGKMARRQKITGMGKRKSAHRKRP